MADKKEQIEKLFEIDVSRDKLECKIKVKTDHVPSLPTVEDLQFFLQLKGIQYGIIEKALEAVINTPDLFHVVAKGLKPENGKDGYVINELLQESDQSKKQSFKINLKDVRKIPSVQKGEKVATIVPPTKGQTGKSIYGTDLPAKPGKKHRMKLGKNVSFNEEDNGVYAKEDGQISIGENMISIQPIYEVQGDLDLKTGNINFIGNVIIHGNVPTGYSVKSKGDIKIYGLVEGADLSCEGSIYITGGIAAGNRGQIYAGEDLHTSYINQATVEAARGIFVESSILHSHCIAGTQVVCKTGSIIGGSVSGGSVIEALDVGNRMQTKTELFLGGNSNLVRKEKELQKEKRDVESNIKKLKLVARKLAEKYQQQGRLLQNEKVFLQKQKITLEQLSHRYEQINSELDSIATLINHQKENKLKVSQTIYPNTYVHFGRYVRMIDRKQTSVIIQFIDNDITISPIM